MCTPRSLLSWCGGQCTLQWWLSHWNHGGTHWIPVFPRNMVAPSQKNYMFHMPQQRPCISRRGSGSATIPCQMYPCHIPWCTRMHLFLHTPATPTTGKSWVAGQNMNCLHLLPECNQVLLMLNPQVACGKSQRETFGSCHLWLGMQGSGHLWQRME